MSGRVFVAILLTLGLAASASAEPLTLEQAVQLAEEASADVQRQEVLRQAAELAWKADPLAGAPSVRVGVRDLGLSGVDPEIVTRLRFPLPRPWDLAAAAKLSRSGEARERAQLRLVQAELRGLVTAYFHQLPLLRDAEALSDELMVIRERHLALIDRRRVEGLSTTLDWLDAEEDRRDTDEDRARLRAELREVEASLRLLIGWDGSEPLELVRPDFDARVAVLPDEGALVAGLLDRSEELAEARADLARSQAQLNRQRLEALPWLDWLQGGVVAEVGKDPSFEVGVALDVPIYRWGPGFTREAEAEMLAARVRVEDVERKVVDRVRRRLADVAAARARWDVERTHQQALEAQAGPLMESADPLLKSELSARSARARLRTVDALGRLILELDSLVMASGG